MTNKEIRDQYNLKYKDSIIETMSIKIKTREERISELLGYIEELENKLIEETKKSIK